MGQAGPTFTLNQFSSSNPSFSPEWHEPSIIQMRKLRLKEAK